MTNHITKKAHVELSEIFNIKSLNDSDFGNMTQKQFQTKLELLRLYTTQTPAKKLTPHNGINQNGKYQSTSDQYYRIFINDILRNIRSGEIDYCFHWYQICELIRFHKDNLNCRLHRDPHGTADCYFSVWLDPAK
ncbi:MAG: hypothetical protein ACLTBR_03365 [Anaerostipes sp.]|uniref:hypothetical protein n=1 Tax=Anaerostipes sp. TaxID=1872530 RepID=UPI003995CFC7